MRIQDAVIVVTGGGSGIGAAMAREFSNSGAAAVVIVDRRQEMAKQVADEVGGIAESVDVGDAAAVRDLVDRVIARYGRIDIFCSNAGIITCAGVEEPDDDAWDQAWNVNLMAHVYAARAVLPSMLARGRGWLVNTASAAGLLTSPGDAPYTATKHAAVGLAEWLAVTYGDRGIGVSVVCPMGVATPLLRESLATGNAGARSAVASGVISPEKVAAAVVSGVEEERFLILPHPEVATLWTRKSSDPQRWLAGIRRHIAQVQATQAGSLADEFRDSPVGERL